MAPSLIEVRVPDMGNFTDVAVIDVLVKPGDTVEVDTPLATLETEKATMDVPSTAAGVVDQVHLSKGDRVSAGSLVVTLRSEGGRDQPATGEAAATEPAEASTPEPASEPAPTTAPTPAAPAAAAQPAATAARAAPPAAVRMDPPPINEPGFSRAHASPSVRKFARELGVDLTNVTGTGFKGRITQDDVKAYVKARLGGGAAPAAGAGTALPRLPVVDFSVFGPTEVKPLSRIQRISGPRLHASWVNIPHVTQFDEADITDLENIRAQLKDKAAAEGVKLTPLAFIMRACVKALKEFPQFNASLDPSGQNLIIKKYMHLGFAVDTPNGLLVPVIRDADRKDVYQLARELGTLSEKARAGKLSAAEMEGGCFTISSLGGIGGTAFTPIINPPEVAILGVSRSVMRPVYMAQTFVPRLILPLSLSYDHRVIDGATGVRFTTYLARVLADARGLLEGTP